MPPTLTAFAMLCCLSGCCGIAEFPTSGQARIWIANEVPKGTSAEVAKHVLKDRGFRVKESTTPANVPMIFGDRRIGSCVLNFTYDYIFVTITLDESGQVVSTTVEDAIRPGI